jgi:hypothetical protein
MAGRLNRPLIHAHQHRVDPVNAALEAYRLSRAAVLTGERAVKDWHETVCAPLITNREGLSGVESGHCLINCVSSTMRTKRSFAVDAKSACSQYPNGKAEAGSGQHL